MTCRVGDVMTPDVVSLREHAQFKDIVQVMREREFSAFPVLDTSDKVVGVVSEDDLLEAARTMHAEHVKRLPVVSDDGRLVGIVSRTDLRGVYDRPDSQIRNEIMTQLIDNEFLLDSVRDMLSYPRL